MASEAPTAGRIPENIMHFVRTLRAAGLPLGPGQMLRAIEAVRAIDITNRRDFYWACGRPWSIGAIRSSCSIKRFRCSGATPIC